MRCWGAKFYTEEGNYDLTTINNPVLINQDAMKFPDAMHAYFNNIRDDMPTATGAHDTFGIMSPIIRNRSIRPYGLCQIGAL